jgi:hypothetical protein
VISALQLLGGDDQDGALAAAPTEPATITTTPATTEEPTAPATPTGTAEPTAAPTQSATPTPPPASFTEEQVATFLDGLAAAATAGDVEQLMAWLHPEVFARYGEDVCRAYLTTTNLALDLTVREVLDPAPWDWITDDGAATTFDSAIEVEVQRTSGSQTILQLMHLVPDDSELRWLTDCGDPR